jgi:CHAD domain-containing protein
MKAIERFTKKRCKRLQALLKSFPSGAEKEDLHQIRLEIKKIKMLLGLIHFNNKKFHDHKNFIPFRTIFRETGKLREANQRKELVDQYTHIHAPFFSSPDRAVRRFIKDVPAHIKSVRKQKKAMLKEIEKIKSRTYTLYLHKKKSELNENLSLGFAQKDLHGLRKSIKEIIYLTSVTKRKNKIDPFLVQSAELIGNWHDKKMLIPWIRTHVPKEKEVIKRLQAECNTDVQNLRKMIAEHRLH